MTDIQLPVAYLEGNTERVFGSEPPNTGSLMGIASDWLRQLDLAKLAPIFRDEVMSGDYDHVLQTFDNWFNTNLVLEYELWREERFYD